ncbi:hypothetical protein M0802_007513 [Mischocyttarus mexicanus]|nr:hypothetical protein M0802_007513 [Mischocyttarus mexicanus]
MSTSAIASVISATLVTPILVDAIVFRTSVCNSCSRAVTILVHSRHISNCNRSRTSERRPKSFFGLMQKGHTLEKSSEKDEMRAAAVSAALLSLPID